jgi:hypothetical protein
MDQPKQVIAAWIEDYTMLRVIAATFIATAAVITAVILKKKQ